MIGQKWHFVWKVQPDLGEAEGLNISINISVNQNTAYHIGLNILIWF